MDLYQQYLEHKQPSTTPRTEEEEYFCNILRNYSSQIVNPKTGRLRHIGVVYQLFQHAVQHDLLDGVSFLFGMTSNSDAKDLFKQSIQYCTSEHMVDALCAQPMPKTSEWMHKLIIRNDPEMFEHFLNHAIKNEDKSDIFQNLKVIWRSGMMAHARIVEKNFDDAMMATGLIEACNFSNVALIDMIYNTARGTIARKHFFQQNQNGMISYHHQGIDHFNKVWKEDQQVQKRLRQVTALEKATQHAGGDRKRTLKM